MTSADLDASRAGIAVLRHGGNAIDAAVATASALGVTEPFVAGPGGGGYMVIYLAHQHRVITIDGREKCPAGCTSTMFQDPSGQPMDFEHARRSGMAVGVPGMVATWADAVRQFGRHSFGADLQPAIGIAEARLPRRPQLPPAGAGLAGRSAVVHQQPATVPHRQRAAAADRHPAAQPRSRAYLRAAGPARPELPLPGPARRRHRPHRAAPAGVRRERLPDQARGHDPA